MLVKCDIKKHMHNGAGISREIRVGQTEGYNYLTISPRPTDEELKYLPMPRTQLSGQLCELPLSDIVSSVKESHDLLLITFFDFTIDKAGAESFLEYSERVARYLGTSSLVPTVMLKGTLSGSFFDQNSQILH